MNAANFITKLGRSITLWPTQFWVGHSDYPVDPPKNGTLIVLQIYKRMDRYNISFY